MFTYLLKCFSVGVVLSVLYPVYANNNMPNKADSHLLENDLKILYSELPRIEALIKERDRQENRQKLSNQYFQLLSIILKKEDLDKYFVEYTFRVTVNSTEEERNAFLKVISAKMFEMDCKSNNFEHNLVGNRYIYKTKDGIELFRFEDNVAICKKIEES